MAVDVCAALGLENATRALEGLDPDGVSTAQVIDSLGRSQSVNVISEAGLYELVLRSRRPEAVRFRRWVYRPARLSVGCRRRPGTPCRP